jgi:hypothetical protein
MAAPLQAADSIGNITELKGNARVVRDTPEEAALEAPIRSYDSVETSNGRMSITRRHPHQTYRTFQSFNR